MLKLDIGCGRAKKQGFIGVDIVKGDGVDYVLDITREKLPLENDLANEVYSHHFFEHVECPKEPLEELIRVSAHGATFEIWTPYLKSNDAFVLGHRQFYNETIWRHICMLHPNLWLKDVDATLRLDKFCYVLYPGITEELRQNDISLSFALNHMFGISSDFGAFMTVLKGKDVKKVEYAEPEIYCSFSTQGPFVKLSMDEKNEINVLSELQSIEKTIPGKALKIINGNNGHADKEESEIIQRLLNTLEERKMRVLELETTIKQITATRGWRLLEKIRKFRTRVSVIRTRR